MVWKQSGPGYLASTTWAVVLSHGWASPEVGGLSVSGVESGVEHTAFGTRGMPPLQGDVEATYGWLDGGSEAEVLREVGEHGWGLGLGQKPLQDGAFRWKSGPHSFAHSRSTTSGCQPRAMF